MRFLDGQSATLFDVPTETRELRSSKFELFGLMSKIQLSLANGASEEEKANYDENGCSEIW